MSETTCPVFHPTPKQFSDLRRYVETIERDHPDIGICKIIPPIQLQLSVDNQERYGIDKIDIPIDIPIKQHVEGGAGVYHVFNLITRAMSVKKFYEVHVDGNDNSTTQNMLVSVSNDDHIDPSKNNTNEVLQQQLYEFIEKKFWKSLGSGVDPVYGADIAGSLFMDDDPWSFDSVLSSDLLRMLPDRIHGVNTSMLYFGCFRALFAYHVEDYDLYSINYLHHGACKSWYSIPPSQRSRFECFANSYFSHEPQQCREYLRHKTKLFSPTKIRQAGITSYSVVQHPGEIVITFPSAFHAGFNHGFNIAEASNFATPRWLTIGRKAKRCICHPDSVLLSIDFIESNYKDVKASSAVSKSKNKVAATKKRAHGGSCTKPMSVDNIIDDCKSPIPDNTKKIKHGVVRAEQSIKAHNIAMDLTTVYKSPPKQCSSSSNNTSNDLHPSKRCNSVLPKHNIIIDLTSDDDTVNPAIRNRFLCVCKRSGRFEITSSSSSIHHHHRRLPNDQNINGTIIKSDSIPSRVRDGGDRSDGGGSGEPIFCCRQCRYYAHVSCIRQHNHQDVVTLCHLCYAMSTEDDVVSSHHEGVNNYDHQRSGGSETGVVVPPTQCSIERRHFFHCIRTPFSRYDQLSPVYDVNRPLYDVIRPSSCVIDVNGHRATSINNRFDCSNDDTGSSVRDAQHDNARMVSMNGDEPLKHHQANVATDAISSRSDSNCKQIQVKLNDRVLYTSRGDGDFIEGALLHGTITNISGKLGRLHIKGQRKDSDIWVPLKHCTIDIPI